MVVSVTPSRPSTIWAVAAATANAAAKKFRSIPPTTGNPRRVLTSKGMDAESKLRHILEEYRQLHFTQEIPTRFKKEVAKAAAGRARQYDPLLGITVGGLEQLVRNVGGTHNQLSPCEVRTVVNLHGDASSGTIRAGQLVQIL